jgi:glycosyltransferase involved in cell wall biosynthesis|tara:strand:+ start:699 stop:1742 length:1044 start_codon:yes stop_codon:yes gene_type:complete
MTVYIVDIEAVDTRYTAQWKTHLPVQLKNKTGLKVKVISGGEVPQATTPGAFLNFGGTNVYKSNQLQQIATLFCEGKINDGDYFLYTDAWNPTVIQLRYMASLLNINITIGGMWHAGSYDPQDFLGRLIGDEPWVRNAERSMFACYNDNFFATQFHIDMFEKTFLLSNKSIKRVGWPMEYLADILSHHTPNKENIVLFPHRIAPEKQHDIFLDLADSFPDYKFITAQDKQLTKNEYHELLAKSKMVFSANLQETLGISWYEGALLGAVPFVPDRLSYSEMAIEETLYPSEWTESFDAYIKHKDELVTRMKAVLESNNHPEISQKVVNTLTDFFCGDKLYTTIKEQST